MVHWEPTHVVYKFRIFSEPRSGLYESMYVCMYAQYFVRNTIIDSCGPGSSVGIETRYELDGPGIESRWGQDFPIPSRPALGLTRPGRGIDHPPPYSAEVKERVELYIYFPSGPFWPVLRWTLLYFTLLYSTLLYCTLLYFTLLYCTLQYFTLLYFTVLYFTVLYCTLLFYVDETTKYFQQ